MEKVKNVYQEYRKYLSLKYKLTTIKGIEYKFKNYILTYFGEFAIDEITVNDYIDFQLKMNELGYSNSFYNQLHIILKRFFDYLGVLYGIENIPKRVGIQKKNKSKKCNGQVKNVWSMAEFKKFIKKVDDPIYHALFCLLYFTGLRKGEALALKITDYSNGYITVNKSITKELYNGKRLLLEPKSINSIRKIRIDDFLNRELKKLVKYYKKNYDDFNDDFFLFGGNKPIAYTTLERKKNLYCEVANVKQIRIHDLRHSHATLLFKNKIEVKLIQERLGHADISTTLNTYVHTDEKAEKKLIEKINLIRSR